MQGELIARQWILRASIAAALVVSLAAATPIHACICNRASPKTAFHYADAVFVGDVTTAINGDAIVAVVEVFKGRLPSTVEIFTSPTGESCGYEGMSVGSRHLFYGYGNSGEFETTSCTRTAKSSEAACDIALLRERAWWWRTWLSRIRVAKRLRLRLRHCDDDRRRGRR